MRDFFVTLSHDILFEYSLGMFEFMFWKVLLLFISSEGKSLYLHHTGGRGNDKHLLLSHEASSPSLHWTASQQRRSRGQIPWSRDLGTQSRPQQAAEGYTDKYIDPGKPRLARKVRKSCAHAAQLRDFARVWVWSGRVGIIPPSAVLEWYWWL